MPSNHEPRQPSDCSSDGVAKDDGPDTSWGRTSGSTSAADEAAALHDLVEGVDRPPDLLVGVLDELVDQLAGLAARRYSSDTSMLVRPPRIAPPRPHGQILQPASEPLSKTSDNVGMAQAGSGPPLLA